MSFRKVLLIVLLLNLTACASVPRNMNLALDAREKINTLDVYVVVPQDEIYAEVRKSTITAAFGGGLVWALVDSAVDSRRSKKQEGLVGPIRDALLEYDYPAVLAREIDREFGNVDWFQLQDVDIDRAADEDRFDRLTKGAQADAVLFVTIDYSLSADFETLDVEADLAMLPKAEALYAFAAKQPAPGDPLKETHAILWRSVSINIALGASNDLEANVRRLSESGAAIVKRAMDESATRIARRLVDELQSTGA